MKRVLTTVLMLGISSAAVAVTGSNSTDQTQRKINSLAQSESENSVQAKEAKEVSRYPAPKEVIELSSALGLSEKQIRESRRIYAVMQRISAEYGQALDRKEARIEKLRAENREGTAVMEQALNESADIQAIIRGAELVAHIEQRSVLTERQLMQYENLKGYIGGHYSHGHNLNLHQTEVREMTAQDSTLD